MPSESKPKSTLMAMSAPYLTGSSGRGGGTRAQPVTDPRKNFGQGEGKSMFSTMPLMGHAMSGTQLGQADSLIRKVSARFAEGGSVKKPVKPSGPSAKERKEIRALVERGKSDAVSALRDTRDALRDSAPEPADDVDGALATLSSRLALKDGGEVQGADDGAMSPELMYQEYQELVQALQDPRIEQELQLEMVDRLAEIEDALERLGITVSPEEA